MTQFTVTFRAEALVTRTYEAESADDAYAQARATLETVAYDTIFPVTNDQTIHASQLRLSEIDNIKES